jgi:caffeoyl-CoA O-methyltransferase
MQKIDRYILNHIDPEEDVLKELDRETNLKVLNPRMLSGHLQGQVLYMISKMISPQRILELGTYTGYSAICLAKGLQPGGKLVTIEIDDELEELAKKYFLKAGIQDRIEQVTGPALEVIPGITGPFDLIFIDADKREYSEYYNLIFGKVKDGGYIIADNTLWNGKVTEPLKSGDNQTPGILKFNEMIKDDTRVEKVILPLRDGMTIIRKKQTAAK